MAQEIYHRSNWGNPTETWGNVYLNADLTNELYKRASEYENSWVTDQLLNGVGTKPSIILTPTAYEDGILNSVKPSQPYSDEIAINGNFDTDSDWSKDAGWTISNGEAIHTGSGSYISQTGTTIGKNYIVVIEVTQASGSGFPQIYMGGLTTAMTSVGTYTFDITATSTLIRLRGVNDCKVSSISVKEVLHADFDFTRGSSATRVNEQGLVSDVQILSGELIQNGDFEQIGSELVINGGFDTDSDWTKGSGWSIEDGMASYDASGTSALTSASTSIVSNKIYRLKFKITTSGFARLNFTTDGSQSLFQPNGNSLNNFADGEYTFYLAAQNNSTALKIFAYNVSGGTAFSIDNVSVKEVGQNWTFFGEAEFTENGARIYSSSGGQSYINQPILTNTKKYRLSYEITDSTTGSLKLINVNGLNDYPIPSTVGTHTLDFIANNNTFFIYRNSGATDVTIDNISVIEVTDDTDLPRINYTNFDYEDVLGDELVTNGTFDDGTNNWGGTATLSVVNGRLKLDGIAGQTADQTITAIVGRKYQVSYDLALGTATSGALIITGGNYPTLDASEGTNTFISTATSTSFRVRPRLGTNGTMFIDNVSVKELTEDVVVPYSGEGSLLLENQSTNLIPYSEDFSDSSWVKLGAGTGSVAIVTSNYAISPDGTQTASRLQCDLNGGVSSSSNQSLIYDLYSSSGNQTISIYVKSNNGQNQTIYFANTQTSGDTITVTPQWQRFEFNHNTTNYVLAIGLRGRGGGAINDTADILIWGAQSEALSYATSYIPTEGSIKTRLQDVCNNSGNSDLINSTSGVLYAEISALADDSTYRQIAISDGTTDNRIALMYTNASNSIRCQVRVSALNQFDQTTTAYNITQNNKIAIKFKANDFALWINGTEVFTDAIGTTPTGLKELAFDDGSGNNDFYGNVKCVAVFKEALSDTELEKLTTI